MKRIGILIICFIALALPLSASVDAGLSFSTFSEIGGDPLLDQGLYVKAGGVVSVTRRIEAGVSAVIELTPDIASSIMMEGKLSYALLSPEFMMGTEVPQYPNMFLGLGGFASVPDLDSWGPVLSLTPLTTGGPQFERKERFAAISLAYDVPGEKFSLFFELFGIDFYL